MSLHWHSSVTVLIGDGLSDVIRGPSEAFEALNNRWPAERGKPYVEAKALCSAAIANASLDEATREAFIKAAIEAKILV